MLNFNSLYQTLPIMCKGMLGILLVTVVIIGCIVVLNKVSSGK